VLTPRGLRAILDVSGDADQAVALMIDMLSPETLSAPLAQTPRITPDCPAPDAVTFRFGKLFWAKAWWRLLRLICIEGEIPQARGWKTFEREKTLSPSHRTASNG
jgi:hypothetical protein